MKEDFDVDFGEVDRFTDELKKFAKDYYPQETKKFLRKEVLKATKKVKQVAKSSVGTAKGKKKNWKENTSYHKSFKTGKVYEYDDDLCCKVYNDSRHAHLIEYGHRQVPRGKKGKSNEGGQANGFTEGKHILEKAKTQFATEFEKDCDNFLGELVENGVNGNF